MIGLYIGEVKSDFERNLHLQKAESMKTAPKAPKARKNLLPPSKFNFFYLKHFCFNLKIYRHFYLYFYFFFVCDCRFDGNQRNQGNGRIYSRFLQN